MAAGPTTRRRQLAAGLGSLRDRAGLTLEAAGEAVGVSRATINRYEASSGPVKWLVVQGLCRAYGASEEETAAMVDLAKTAKVIGWWKTFGDAVPEIIQPLLTLEDEAVEECHWAPTYVPGLLQTRAYASAVIQASDVRANGDEIARKTDVRMKRQEVLTRKPPPHLWAIMDEAVVRRRVGGAGVMAGQLAHLATSASLPHVTLQILPFESGAHAAESTGFMIIRGAEASLDVVHLSNLSGALYLEKPADLARHRMVFEYLRSQALSRADTGEMISTLGEQFAEQAREES